MVVYKTTNLINGKSYIGKDKHNNPNYLGSGKRLQYAIKKYGKENFKKEILEHCNSYDELRDREVFWICKFNAAESIDFYNVAEENYGVGNFKGFKESDWENFSKKMSIISAEKWKDKTFRNTHRDAITNWHKNMSKDVKQRRAEKIQESWKDNKESRKLAIKEGQKNSKAYQNRDLSRSGRKAKVIITAEKTKLIIDMYTAGSLRSKICKTTLLSKWQVNKILKTVGLIK
jgi:hypothetical protein